MDRQAAGVFVVTANIIKTIPASPVRNWLGFLLQTQIHSSQYKEFVFARYGGADDVKDERFISLRETFFEVFL